MRYITPGMIVKGRLGKNPKPNWDIVVICFHSQEKSQMLVNYFNANPLGYSVFSKVNDNDVLEAKVGKKKVGILRWCTGGGPITAALVEELAFIGVKYIIGIGAAASISKNINKGDIVVAEEASIKDGTSKSYWPLEDMLFSSKELTDIVKKAGMELCLNIKGTRAVTVDTIYRETEELISPWREEGCQILNWEITPLYAASKACKVKSIWMGHISDKLVTREWDNWFCSRNKIHMNCVKICKKAIEMI